MSEHGLHLEQSLQQTIGPQMQQSLQILQAPTVELQQLIRNELAQNPTLEDITEETSLEEVSLGEDGFEENLDAGDEFNEEWNDFLDQSSHTVNRRADEDERRQFMLDSLVAPPTLQAHLQEQLDLADPNEEVREAAEVLLGDLDDRGFLETPLEDLCLSLALPLPDLEEAKKLINSFEPSGVGAIALQDSLLIQLTQLGLAGKLPYRIVQTHLPFLARHRYEEIARNLGVSTAEVLDSQQVISNLDPLPARAFSPDPTVYVSPDVIVREDRHGKFQVTLTNESIPDLRISEDYREMLAESKPEPSAKEARNYIRDNIRGGKFLIRSIEQRQETILRIAHQIVERQNDFLREGPEHLRPMNMAQIAEVIGVHETTVSRAVSGKYMHTPQGLFELRYFFTTGYQTSDGEALSNISVKNTISELVSGEDPSKPLSDQKIVEELKERGIKIARRTVAKYRDALHILPSHLRKS